MIIQERWIKAHTKKLKNGKEYWVRKSLRNIHMLDWDDILSGYNRIYGTSYGTVKEMLEWLLKTETKKHVMKVLGVEQITLNRVIKELEIDYIGIAPQKRIHQIRRMGAERVEAMDMKELCEMFACSEESMRSTLNKIGFSYVHRNRKYTEEERAEAIEMLERGVPVSLVSEKIGYARSALYKMRRELNMDSYK